MQMKMKLKYKIFFLKIKLQSCMSMYVFCAPAFFVRNQRQGRKLLISTRRWKLYISMACKFFLCLCLEAAEQRRATRSWKRQKVNWKFRSIGNVAQNAAQLSKRRLYKVYNIELLWKSPSTVFQSS